MTGTPEQPDVRARYLDLLEVDAAERARLADAGADDGRQTMSDLQRLLTPDDAGEADNPALASVGRRVQLACGLQEPDCPPLAPAIRRSSMVPHPWTPLNPLVRGYQSAVRHRGHWVERKEGEQRPAWPAQFTPGDEDVPDGPDPRGRWQFAGNVRRLVLLTLMIAQTLAGTWFMSRVVPYQGTAWLEMVLLLLFAILFCWVSAGFWTAMAGFWLMLRGTDRYLISRQKASRAPIAPGARTAIVMPICNEDVIRVSAGLRATYESLAKTGELAHFDFFILSDSNDPDTCAAELEAWSRLCRELDGFGRIFYRRRRRRVKRKSGNIDDFCRRWGAAYRYMVVLDADSVMSGDCLATLVRLMEGNPGAGIIQTAPVAAGRDTLYARIQQFSTRVYGPLFTAGLHYWQLGESHYWGHNAIIRLAPFIKHCALAPLPGRGSLAGEILSHDFVEAALMRRAGWGVWIAYDLEGSYEEMPPNLLDELKRDRRWCHGNLMNFRLFTARGMHPVHRAVFATGVMAYLSAPLWFLFLALSTALLAMHTLVEPQYFFAPRQLFPVWPQWHPDKALALFSATATLLFLPKILSIVTVGLQGARGFGGILRVTASVVLEILFSMLLAPVRMLFHTRYVLAAFLGWAIHWKSPPRADSETTPVEALTRHGGQMLLGLGWLVGIYLLNPTFLPWLLPIAGGMLLSGPLSVWSSRVSLGRLTRRLGLFLIPEERTPAPELLACAKHVAATPPLGGFVDAIVDPKVNALACCAARHRRRLPDNTAKEREALHRTALTGGPEALGNAERLIVLDDPVLLSRLHLEVWSSPHAHPVWRERVLGA
ncbi:glucans biosynthesis glucosyltransferase MdoH [Noviherbaspirillum aridicola]|uniref:Glucans biosynthesis glucosyltransferase H n=1 Tax=Noviherbaspirillum aridicola TaxID=2849687 RepID=A0ABQ4Q3B3_9BURK|nr:glucans biosynthesis glucosyltransferase MdoH [Noviherbaspirillum aridicola]GIZ51594.1 glucans biosynthesis glucosyltransferase H [Noviherbaspirillum aridicola]